VLVSVLYSSLQQSIWENHSLYDAPRMSSVPPGSKVVCSSKVMALHGLAINTEHVWFLLMTSRMLVVVAVVVVVVVIVVVVVVGVVFASCKNDF
jgi:hypothetical protein